MTPARRELLVAQILAGETHISLERAGRKPARFSVAEPATAAARLRLAAAHTAAFEEARAAGLPTFADSVEMLRQTGEWEAAEDRRLEEVEKDVERLKVAYFKAFHTRDKETVGRHLAAAKGTLEGLLALRASLSHLTAETAAATARARHLVGAGLRRLRDAKPLWSGTAFMRSRSDLLDRAVAAWMRAQPTQAEVRELARTDPWRTIWACRDAAGRGVFDSPAAGLSEAQKSLVAWTRVYDSAREDAERPSEEILADDDAFDGWMAVRREAADAQDAGRMARLAGTTNPKILGAEAVFVCRPEDDARTPEEFARQVYAANSTGGRQIAEATIAAVAEAGRVSAFQTPEKLLATKMAVNRGG